jgi:nitroreductase
MKIKMTFLFIILLGSVKLTGQNPGNLTDILLTSYSERSYTSQPVTDHDLNIILQCGIKAPSGRNNQPWRFTVINDEATMKEAINDVVAGNTLIIISGAEGQNGTTPDFDCGLATESMFIAAHSLGLGARIYGSPAANINSKKDLFQIPSGFKAIVVLRIGSVVKSPDAVSSATTRKKPEDLVNFKK